MGGRHGFKKKCSRKNKTVDACFATTTYCVVLVFLSWLWHDHDAVYMSTEMKEIIIKK